MIRKLLRLSQNTSSGLILYKANLPAISHQQIIVLDFEFDRTRNINEIGAILVAGEQILDIFHVTLPCSRLYRDTIPSLSTLAYLYRMPTQGEEIAKLLEFIDDRPIFAHNAGVERRLLTNHANKYNLRLNNNQFICTINILRKILPKLPSYQLSKITKQLDLPRPDIYHRALNDAYATFEILLEVKKILSNKHQLYSSDHYNFIELVMSLPTKKVVNLLENYEGRELLLQAKRMHAEQGLIKPRKILPAV